MLLRHQVRIDDAHLLYVRCGDGLAGVHRLLYAEHAWTGFRKDFHCVLLLYLPVICKEKLNVLHRLIDGLIISSTHIRCILMTIVLFLSKSQFPILL